MIFYGGITFIALAWAQVFRRTEKACDAEADKTPPRSGLRRGLLLTASVMSTACAACVGTAAWAGLGFFLAAWRSFQ